jgi:hypothetical protein
MVSGSPEISSFDQPGQMELAALAALSVKIAVTANTV